MKAAPVLEKDLQKTAKQPTRIIGIDPSLGATGVVLLVDGKVADWELIVGGTRRGVIRLSHMRDSLAETIRDWSPLNHAAIEGYSFGSGGRALVSLGELGGVYRMLLNDVGIPITEIPPGTWRKQLLGRGNLPKDQVRVEAWKRYLVEFDNLDVLEAWAVAMSLQRTLLGLDKPEPKKRSRRAA